MDITLELLLYFMRELKPAVVKQPSGRRLYRGVHYLIEEEEHDSSFLFVVSLSELRSMKTRLPADLTLLVSADCGYEENDLFTMPCGIILVDGKYKVPSLINRLTGVFQLLTEWDKNMHIAALEGKSLQEIVDLSETVIGYPLIVFDAAFDVLAFTRKLSVNYANYDGTVKSGYTDSRTMELVKEHKILSRLQKNTPLVAPAVEDPSITNVYLSFYGDDNIIGYGCIFMEKAAAEPGFLDLIRLFSANLNFCLKRDFDNQRFGQMLYETFLLNLISNPLIPEEQVKEQIKNVEGLSLTGRFVLTVISFGDRTNVPFKFLARQMEMLLKNTKPFIMEDRICLLRLHETDGVASPSGDWDQLERILGGYPYQCGVSNEFRLITDLKYAYHQADAALRFGKDSGQKILPYSRYCLSDLLHAAEANMPVRLLQMGLYNQLLDYDSRHGTSYKEIILQYIHCDCNATHTAEKLFLHRNTVRNAVLFVEEKWDVRITDEETKQVMLLGEAAEQYLLH